MMHHERRRPVFQQLTLLVLLPLASLGCGGSSSSRGVYHQTGKVVALGDQELEIGPVLESQNTIKCNFKILNTTKSHITFKKLATSCVCTDAHLDKDELAPGEATKLRFQANIKGRPGKRRFTCRVDQEGGPSFLCSAVAIVCPPVEFEEPHVSLGSLEHSTTMSFSKKLYVNTTQAEKERYKILRLEPPQGMIDASLIFREERAIGNQILQKIYDVKVNILPSATSQPGKRTSSLILTYADQEGPGGTIIMEVSWTTPEHLQTNPHRVVFGSITDTNKKRQRDVILECSSQSEPRFRILRTDSSHPGLSVLSTTEIPGTDGRQYKIRIALDPSKIDDFFSESITILTDHPLTPSIRLPVIARKARTQK